MLLSTTAAWAWVILPARLVPGPTFLTAAARSTSCSIAPRTWTTKLAVATFPDASVAVQITGVSPIRNCEPEGGVLTTAGTGSMVSTAVTAYSTKLPPGEVASTTKPSGTVRTGNVTS